MSSREVICSSQMRDGAYVCSLRISTPLLGLAAPDPAIMLHGFTPTRFARAGSAPLIRTAYGVPALGDYATCLTCQGPFFCSSVLLWLV